MKMMINGHIILSVRNNSASYPFLTGVLAGAGNTSAIKPH